MRTGLLFMLYSLTILMEKYFGFLIPISFERSTKDLKKNHRKSLKNISSQLPVKKVKEFNVYSVIGNEAGKDQYVTGIELAYLDNSHTSKKVDLVTKYLSSREEPLYLSALKSAIYRGLNQEVTFYNQLSERIPFKTPKCIFAESAPLLYRGIIVMEKLTPDLFIDDYVGCTTPHSENVIRSIAKMHAKFWNRVVNDSSLQWLPSRHPLGSFWFLNYITKKERSCVVLWDALYEFFTNHPMTVVHGDCRPGNIMWFDDGSVSMLDWQFVNAGIGTWDTTYFIVMAHDPEIRRDTEELLLEQYYTDLRDSYSDFHSQELSYTEEICAQDHQLLKLVLGLYGWAALVSRMFDKYGNDPRDVRCWADRITAAIVDLDSQFVSNRIKVSSAVVDDFKNIMKRASDLTKERFVSLDN